MLPLGSSFYKSNTNLLVSQFLSLELPPLYLVWPFSGVFFSPKHAFEVGPMVIYFTIYPE